MDQTQRSDCAERQRLLADLEEKIKETIRARGKPESNAAYKQWQAARKAFAGHIKQHGC
jgi:hypothetical protein